MNVLDHKGIMEGKRLVVYAEMPDLYEICVSAVAFANQSGGEIAVGVNPNTLEILGLSDFEVSESLLKIPHVIGKLCSPTIVPEIYVKNVAGHHILMVRIAMGSMKPYYIRDEGDRDGVYIRQFKANRHASKIQIDELIRESENQSFDEILVRDYHLDDLNLSELKEDVHRLVHMEISDSDLLRLGLFDRLIPTRALAILSGDEQRFGYAKIICVRHRISSGGGFEDEIEEMRGSLPKQVVSAIEFLLADQEFCSQQLPRKLLLEVIVNAVVHRDYALRDHSVIIDTYPDRLIISSPGGLPKTMTLSQILEGTSEARNPLISNFMRSIGYAGSWGTGVLRILEICIENQIFTPTFVEEGIFFKVIFDICAK